MHFYFHLQGIIKGSCLLNPCHSYAVYLAVLVSIKMPADGSRPKITDMPVVLEPPFPTFTPRPLKENLNKQTANLILVNTSPHKLIFKIVPNSTDINYLIQPEIDYLAPNGCRLIGISINDTPKPKKGT